MYNVKIAAEIGTAHNGDLNKAKELISCCKECGADYVKFQWVYADEILHPDTGNVKLPGGTIPLYSRFKSLEVPPLFFKECMEYARSLNLKFMCSPFGIKSLNELADLKPDAIKIASPELNHIPLLKECAKYYGKIPLVISSGVSKLKDIERAIEILTAGNSQDSENQNVKEKDKNLNSDIPPLTLLHCSTFYPTPEEEYNVKLVKTLSEITGLPSGISDHSLDPVLVPVLSAAMGGTFIEKHITLSNETDGLDDAVALTPQKFAMMVHTVHQTQAVIDHIKKEKLALVNYDIAKLDKEKIFDEVLSYTKNQLAQSYSLEKINKCIGSGIKKLSPSENANYGRTNRSLHFIHSMKKGDVVKKEDIGILRTEKILSLGIESDFLETVTGCVLTKDAVSGEGVTFEHFLSREKI